MHICPICLQPIASTPRKSFPIHRECLGNSVLFSKAPANSEEFKKMMGDLRIDSFEFSDRLISASNRIAFLRNLESQQDSLGFGPSFSISTDQIKDIGLGVVPFIGKRDKSQLIDRIQWEYNFGILLVLREAFRLRHPVFHYLDWNKKNENNFEYVLFKSNTESKQKKLILSDGKCLLGKRKDFKSEIDNQEIANEIENSEFMRDKFFIKKVLPDFFDLENPKETFQHNYIEGNSFSKKCAICKCNDIIQPKLSVSSQNKDFYLRWFDKAPPLIRTLRKSHRVSNKKKARTIRLVCLRCIKKYKIEDFVKKKDFRIFKIDFKSLPTFRRYSDYLEKKYLETWSKAYSKFSESISPLKRLKSDNLGLNRNGYKILNKYEEKYNELVHRIPKSNYHPISKESYSQVTQNMVFNSNWNCFLNMQMSENMINRELIQFLKKNLLSSRNYEKDLSNPTLDNMNSILGFKNIRKKPNQEEITAAKILKIEQDELFYILDNIDAHVDKDLFYETIWDLPLPAKLKVKLKAMKQLKKEQKTKGRPKKPKNLTDNIKNKESKEKSEKTTKKNISKKKTKAQTQSVLEGLLDSFGTEKKQKEIKKNAEKDVLNINIEQIYTQKSEEVKEKKEDFNNQSLTLPKNQNFENHQPTQESQNLTDFSPCQKLRFAKNDFQNQDYTKNLKKKIILPNQLEKKLQEKRKSWMSHLTKFLNLKYDEPPSIHNNFGYDKHKNHPGLGTTIDYSKKSYKRKYQMHALLEEKGNYEKKHKLLKNYFDSMLKDVEISPENENNPRIFKEPEKGSLNWDFIDSLFFKDESFNPSHFKKLDSKLLEMVYSEYLFYHKNHQIPRNQYFKKKLIEAVCNLRDLKKGEYLVNPSFKLSNEQNFKERNYPHNPNYLDRLRQKKSNGETIQPTWNESSRRRIQLSQVLQLVYSSLVQKNSRFNRVLKLKKFAHKNLIFPEKTDCLFNFWNYFYEPLNYLDNVVYPVERKLGLLKNKISVAREKWNHLFAQIIPKMMLTFSKNYFLNHPIYQGLKLYFQDFLKFDDSYEFSIDFFQTVIRKFFSSSTNDLLNDNGIWSEIAEDLSLQLGTDLIYHFISHQESRFIQISKNFIVFNDYIKKIIFLNSQKHFKINKELLNNISKLKETDCVLCFTAITCLSNPIIYCSKCERGAHMICLKLPNVPNDDFFCLSCKPKHKKFKKNKRYGHLRNKNRLKKKTLKVGTGPKDQVLLIDNQLLIMKNKNSASRTEDINRILSSKLLFHFDAKLIEHETQKVKVMVSQSSLAHLVQALMRLNYFINLYSSKKNKFKTRYECHMLQYFNTLMSFNCQKPELKLIKNPKIMRNQVLNPASKGIDLNALKEQIQLEYEGKILSIDKEQNKIVASNFLGRGHGNYGRSNSSRNLKKNQRQKKLEKKKKDSEEQFEMQSLAKLDQVLEAEFQNKYQIKHNKSSDCTLITNKKDKLKKSKGFNGVWKTETSSQNTTNQSKKIFTQRSLMLLKNLAQSKKTLNNCIIENYDQIFKSESNRDYKTNSDLSIDDALRKVMKDLIRCKNLCVKKNQKVKTVSSSSDNLFLEELRFIDNRDHLKIDKKDSKNKILEETNEKKSILEETKKKIGPNNLDKKKISNKNNIKDSEKILKKSNIKEEKNLNNKEIKNSNKLGKKKRRRRRRDRVIEKLTIIEMPDCKLELPIQNDECDWQSEKILIFENQTQKIAFIVEKSFNRIVNEQIPISTDIPHQQKCVFCGKSDFMVIFKNNTFFHLFCVIFSKNLKIFFGRSQNSLFGLVLYVKILRVYFEKLMLKKNKNSEMKRNKKDKEVKGDFKKFDSDLKSLGFESENIKDGENKISRNDLLISEILFENKNLCIDILIICEKLFYQILLLKECFLCNEKLLKANNLKNRKRVFLKKAWKSVKEEYIKSHITLSPSEFNIKKWLSNLSSHLNMKEPLNQKYPIISKFLKQFAQQEFSLLHCRKCPESSFHAICGYFNGQHVAIDPSYKEKNNFMTFLGSECFDYEINAFCRNCSECKLTENSPSLEQIEFLRRFPVSAKMIKDQISFPTFLHLRSHPEYGFFLE